MSCGANGGSSEMSDDETLRALAEEPALFGDARVTDLKRFLIDQVDQP